MKTPFNRFVTFEARDVRFPRNFLSLCAICKGRFGSRPTDDGRKRKPPGASAVPPGPVICPARDYLALPCGPRRYGAVAVAGRRLRPRRDIAVPEQTSPNRIHSL